MADQQAGGRPTLALGLTLQILLWALGTMALFLSGAIDFGSDRYPTHFTYTTPLYLRDVLGMIALARPTDFLVPTVTNIILWFSVLSALLLILDRERRIRASWRVLILGIQSCLFGILAPHGALSLLTDLPQLLTARLDGEWLGEGWNYFEASALWMITIVILLLQLLLPVRGRRAGNGYNPCPTRIEGSRKRFEAGGRPRSLDDAS